MDLVGAVLCLDWAGRALGLLGIFLMAAFLPSLLLVFLHGAPFQLEKFSASRNPMTRPPEEEERVEHP